MVQRIRFDRSRRIGISWTCQTRSLMTLQKIEAWSSYVHSQLPRQQGMALWWNLGTSLTLSTTLKSKHSRLENHSSANETSFRKYSKEKNKSCSSSIRVRKSIRSSIRNYRTWRTIICTKFLMTTSGEFVMNITSDNFKSLSYSRQNTYELVK